MEFNYEGKKLSGIELAEMEQKLVSRISMLEGMISDKTEILAALKNSAYLHKQIRSDIAEKLESESKTSIDDAQEKLYEKTRNDQDIRHPHRKIMEYLIGEYDYEMQEFKSVHFSKLVKETKIGKNMANSYLQDLKDKKYIECWTDGYRTFFRVLG